MTADEVVAELTGDLKELARIDWLYANRCDRLHAPATATYDANLWLVADVTMACGWHVETALIPGLFSRMGVPRCATCCDKTGMPHGKGSPKNDDQCRYLLGLDGAQP